MRFRIAVLAAVVVIAVGASPSPSASAAPLPNAAPGYNELCDSLPWPRPMPAVVGLTFDGKYEFGQLACLLGARVIDADGRVVYENGEHTGRIGPHRIVDVSPAPGTPIGRHDPVTINVVEENYNAAPESGLRPCDWVSTTEASDLLGELPVTASTSGDHKGSTDVACSYTSSDGGRGVDTWLTLTGRFIIDAATAFDFHMAHGNEDVTSIDGLGAKAACVLTNHPGGARHHVWVVLPGERILIVSDSSDLDRVPGESCDTLTQFARIAIPRIPS